jgi:ring-1,2-phenylacetyl-CoA epoxidase subunit PaaD
VVNEAASVRAALGRVVDPEIPALTIFDLGIVREIRVADRRVEVVITPTYSGCPASHAIEDAIRRALDAAGFPDATIRTSLAPAWTTDWISAAGRDKLARLGIAPPGARAATAMPLHFHRSPLPQVACPRCGSSATERLSEFGSTACKALYRCRDCREPFDYFKPI